MTRRAPTHLPGASRPRQGGPARPVLAVALMWVVLVIPLVQPLSAQGAPRLALVGALVDDGALEIDGYLLGKDFTTRGGRTYSDKAPGQPLLSVPAYAAARLVGAEPARIHRAHENLGLWWITTVSGTVPVLALLALVASALRRRGLAPSVPVLVGLTFGTMLLPLASNLYGHVLSGALAYASWWVLDRRPTGRLATGLLAGAAAGAAVAVEYQVALVVAVVATWLLVRRRGSALAGLVLGGLPSAAVVMAYQLGTTGSALRSGYQTKEWEGQQGFFSTHLTHPPDPLQLAEVLLGSRGLLVFTPVVLLGVIGLVGRWRRDRDDAGPVGLAAVGALLLLQASWSNTWAGEGPGPRYVAPALPFLAVGLAEAWPRTAPLVRRLVLAVSVTTMGLATVTSHLTPPGSVLGVHHLEKALGGHLTPTLLSMGLGRAGPVVHLALVAAAAVVAVRLARPSRVATSVPPGPVEHHSGTGPASLACEPV